MIELTYGSQSFPRSSCKVTIFVLDTENEKNGNTETIFPRKVMGKTVSHNTIPASINGLNSHGRWWVNKYEDREGTLLLVKTTITKSGRPWADAAMVLMTSSMAPLITLDAMPVPYRKATLSTIPAFKGKAYILDKEGMKLAGVKFSDSFIDRYMQDDEIEEVYKVTVHKKGKAELSAIKVPGDNQDKVVIAPVSSQPARKLRIRKR